MPKANAASGTPTVMDGVVDVRLTAYQLTVGGLRLPVLAHYVVNLVAATGMFFLGHPLAAAALFIGASAIDSVQQFLFRRWLAVSQDADEKAGFRKLAMLCVARVTF